MTLIRLPPEPAEPLTLAEARTYLRLPPSDGENALLAGLIAAARTDVEQATGLALMTQTFRLSLDRLPRRATITLPRHPVQAVLAVTVAGPDGQAVPVPPDRYRTDLASRPARVRLDGLPVAPTAIGGLSIDFTAGFGDSGTAVPDLLKRAILVLTAHWYEMRGFTGADSAPGAYPAGFDRLIAGYRRRRL